jgi:hypothetical protein
MMIEMIFVLLVVFQLKHYLADFPLQNAYMLGKFKESGWVLPLTAHCGVHAYMTLMIAAVVTGNVGVMVGVAALDFSLHFAMDRLKASPKMWGRFKPTETRFWSALGFDQMFHHLTHYLIIAIIVLAVA